MKKIHYIIAVALFAFVASSCMNETMPNSSAKGVGQFVLSILTEEVETEDITRSGSDDLTFATQLFKVSLKDKAGIALFQNKQYGNLSDGDRTLPSGTGYQIVVESCNEAEATTSNEGWGQARFYGADTFDIVSDETTPLAIQCQLYNAGLKLVFDSAFVAKFPVYAATTQDSRSLVFKGSTSGKVAYYNLEGEAGSVSLRLTGSAGGWSDRIDLTRDVAITKGKITRLFVIYDENSGDIDIDFDTDSDMDESSDDVTIQ